MKTRTKLLLITTLQILKVICIIIMFPIWIGIWIITGFDVMEYSMQEFYEKQQRIKNEN